MITAAELAELPLFGALDDDVLAYLRTWSATQACLRETGVDPTLALGDELRALWGAPETTKSIVWPLAIRCGRMT